VRVELAQPSCARGGAGRRDLAQGQDLLDSELARGEVRRSAAVQA
jgi:hypothetical protein